MLKIILIIFSFCFLPSCAYLGYLKDPFADIPNFHEVNPQLYRGGMLDKTAGWDKLKTLKIKSIISFEEENPQSCKRKQTAESFGLKVYSIPVSLYAAPTDKQVLEFLTIALTSENQPIFVYCNNGRDRSGVMIALYRVVVEGWTIKNAYHEAVSLGYWPYYGEDTPLKNFIHQLKDKKIYFKKAHELKNEKNN